GTLLHLARLVFARLTRRRKLRSDFVVTRVTRDLFDQIFFLFDIDTPRRHLEVDSIFRFDRAFKTEAGQNANDLTSLDGKRRECRDALRLKTDHSLAERLR